MNRHARQLALPEITPALQQKLQGTRLVMIGAGGLGAAALPYLAGAGLGNITIIDHDDVDIINLHRQTIFKDNDAGKNKAECAAEYLKALNPEISVHAIPEKLTSANAAQLCSNSDLLLDGSDNFETKSLLNEISIKTKTPLISASVEQFSGSAAIFAGFEKNAPCYHCLFPELPLDCRSCSEAGILGTVAGIAGLYQAHLALCFLLGIGEAAPGTVLSFDFKNFRTQHLKLQKNPSCALCKGHSYGAKKPAMTPAQIPLIHPDDLSGHFIVDVRTNDEVIADPIPGALHMQLDTIPNRHNELPKDKPLAFVCASNVRSRRAAEYLHALGYEDVCVMDRLAG